MFAKRIIYSVQPTKVSCYKYLHCRGKKSIILHSFVRKTEVSYYITFFQTLLKRAAFVMLKLQQRCRNCQTKYRTIFQVKEENRRFICFHRNASLHASNMFLSGNAIADELPNIQFSLTTVRDTSLPGIQTYFIYSSRIIGKPPWISFETFRSFKQI